MIGTPIAGRDHPDLEDQIGFYVNTLVFRDAVRGEESFTALMARVRETAQEAYEHRVYPFDRLVDRPGNAPPDILSRKEAIHRW